MYIQEGGKGCVHEGGKGVYMREERGVYIQERGKGCVHTRGRKGCVHTRDWSTTIFTTSVRTICREDLVSLWCVCVCVCVCVQCVCVCMYVLSCKLSAEFPSRSLYTLHCIGPMSVLHTISVDTMLCLMF